MSDDTFNMEFTTPLSEQECRLIIKAQNQKDIEEAEIIIKIMEGKASELGYMRRRVAGAILSQFQKLSMSEEKRQYILYNLRLRVKNGTEQFISYDNGKLVVEFDEFGKLGSDTLNRTKTAEKNLMKRFKATSFRYLPKEKKMDGENSVN